MLSSPKQQHQKLCLQVNGFGNRNATPVTIHSDIPRPAFFLFWLNRAARSSGNLAVNSTTDDHQPGRESFPATDKQVINTGIERGAIE
ncbi:MAG TPA: hypothetical protein DCF45_00205 [Gammaproteobacteria bacterium]|nr:hypothetical protein [Gammaproteobacteria bacterium]